MFAVTFGLAMDYEVFIVSRMKEGRERLGDAREAAIVGLACRTPQRGRAGAQRRARRRRARNRRHPPGDVIGSRSAGTAASVIGGGP
jgi:uncharacterized membrane protein YdfJ with MMPL/SSD domain